MKSQVVKKYPIELYTVLGLYHTNLLPLVTLITSGTFRLGFEGGTISGENEI